MKYRLNKGPPKAKQTIDVLPVRVDTGAKLEIQLGDRVVVSCEQWSDRRYVARRTRSIGGQVVWESRGVALLVPQEPRSAHWRTDHWCIRLRLPLAVDIAERFIVDVSRT